MSEALTRTFPPEVHESLAALRQIAKHAKSRQEPGLRYATPDEIALAETYRKPEHCTAHSTRTGLPCEARKVKGANVCIKHGASASQVRNAAELRLLKGIDPMLARLRTLAQQSDHLPTAYNAVADWLDRAGVGELVQSKMKAATKDTASKITVNIGFLTNGQPPDVVTITNDQPEE